MTAQVTVRYAVQGNRHAVKRDGTNGGPAAVTFGLMQQGTRFSHLVEYHALRYVRE